MLFPSIFGIVVGIGMIGQWAASLASKQVPEIRDEPIRIAFHLAAEMATALCLIIGGIGLLAAYGWGKHVFLVAVGMLFYTAIVSPGYFAQKGQWLWIGIFMVLIGLGLASIFFVI